MAAADPCPCGSGATLDACCGPILAGVPAPTAQALMRSRYTAYVRGAMAHIVSTHAPETRASIDVAAATKWSADTLWMGLEIVATERGLAGDDVGFVEFIARGVTKDAPFVLCERSRFRRDGAAWYYVDGVAKDVYAAPPRR